MRLVPSGTSTSFPLMVSLGMRARLDQVLELRAELLDVADVWPDGSVVEGADGRPRAALRDVEDGVQVFLATLALDDAAGHLVDPPGGLAARRALAAALVGIEARDDHERLGHGHRVVHHDDAGRADHGAFALGPLHVHLDVDLVRRQDGGRGAAGHDGLELPPAADAAAMVVDQLPQRDGHWRFDATRLHDMTGDGIQPRAALALGAEAREPLRAPVDDGRHRHDGLDVVDDGGVAARPLAGGEGRLDLRPPLLPLERRQEPGLLAADIRAGAAVDHDVEVESGTLDVLAEEPRLVGFLDRAVHDPPRLHVFAPDIDEAQVRADGARRDDHPLDHGVRVPLHQVAVLEGPRLALVGVDHEVLRIRGAFRNESPLHARRKGRAAQPAQVGLLDLL